MEQPALIRGNSPAKIDEKGRLKIPSAYRDFMEQHGPQVFVTSLRGECVLVYPMAVWLEKERKLAAMPSTHPARERYLRVVNYYGQVAEIDKQARVLIHPLLREKAQMNGDVDVLGQLDHLEVWNHERNAADMDREPLTKEHQLDLAQYGV